MKRDVGWRMSDGGIGRWVVRSAGARVSAMAAVVVMVLAGVALVATGPEACAQSGAAKPPGWNGTAKSGAPHPSAAPTPSPARGEGAGGAAGGAGGVSGGGGGGVGGAVVLPAEVAALLDEARRGGYEVELEVDDLGWITTSESGSGTGAGLSAEGDKLVTEWDGSAPSVVGPGGRAVSGGGARSASTGMALRLPDGVGSAPLLWAGILLLVAAGAGGWFLKSVKFGLVFGGIGGVLIAVGLYPAIALWGVLGAIAIAVVYALRSDAVAARFRESTRALVGAIDHPTVEPDAKTAVAGALAMEADASDKAVIASVRAKDAGLAFAGTV